MKESRRMLVPHPAARIAVAAEGVEAAGEGPQLHIFSNAQEHADRQPPATVLLEKSDAVRQNSGMPRNTSRIPTVGRKEADFSKDVIRTLTAEAGYVCANPSCCAPTFAAGSTMLGIGTVGEAAHISAAAEGSARWLPYLEPETRRSAANGIWLCNTHAREIDIDEHRHTIALLHSWKKRAKARALAARGKPKPWVPTRRSELIRASRFLNVPGPPADAKGSIGQNLLGQFVDQFIEDVGGNALWEQENLECLGLALYEIALNAVQHSKAEKLHLRSRGYRIDLVHNGSDFNPMNLIEGEGNGGHASLRYLVEQFGNSLTLRYKHNGEVATIQFIDVSVAGPQHPCAVEMTAGWAETYSGVIESCTVVHLFPQRRMKFSDSRELNLPGEGDVPKDTVFVLHNTNPRVIEHFRKTIPTLRAPGYVR